MDFRKGKGREELEINLIPFIDVLLVILIFMMVTTTYSKFSTLHVQLPTEEGDHAKEQPTMIQIEVDERGQIAVDGHIVAATDPVSLVSELKHANDEKSGKVADVEIVAAADAKNQWVMNVLQAAGDAGFANVAFKTETSAGKK